MAPSPFSKWRSWGLQRVKDLLTAMVGDTCAVRRTCPGTRALPDSPAHLWEHIPCTEPVFLSLSTVHIWGWTIPCHGRVHSRMFCSSPDLYSLGGSPCNKHVSRRGQISPGDKNRLQSRTTVLNKHYILFSTFLFFWLKSRWMVFTLFRNQVKVEHNI